MAFQIWCTRLPIMNIWDLRISASTDHSTFTLLLGGVCLWVTKIIPRNLRLEFNIPLFGKWEPHKYVQEYNFPRKAIYPRFPPFLPHVHPFFHPFYCHEIAWESFIPWKWKPMILNKIPYLPLSFPLNFSLLFPLIFSPVIFYKKRNP